MADSFDEILIQEKHMEITVYSENLINFSYPIKDVVA